MRTQRGLEVSVSSADALKAIDAFDNNFLGMRKEVDDIVAAAATFPDVPMLQAYAAIFYLHGRKTHLIEQAGPYLEAAENALKHVNERESLFIRAVRCFYEYRYNGACLQLEALTERWPQDLVAAKFAESLYYLMGYEYSGPRYRKHMERLRPYHLDSADFWAMDSFSAELCDDYQAARSSAERSIQFNQHQPWAHHTLAHLLICQGQSKDGIRELEQYAGFWPNHNRGIYCHNSWHLALLYLQEMSEADVRSILKNDIWGITPDWVVEQVDAVSLLWRLDMIGKGNDEIWPEIANYVEGTAGSYISPFFEAHYIYALARNGQRQRVDDIINNVESKAICDTGVWERLGARLLKATSASAVGDWHLAVAEFEPILEVIPQSGGSDAQLDLFRLAYVTALKNVGRRSDAKACYQAFFGNKEATAWDAAFI